jgi:hypothetical protein
MVIKYLHQVPLQPQLSNHFHNHIKGRIRADRPLQMLIQPAANHPLPLDHPASNISARIPKKDAVRVDHGQDSSIISMPHLLQLDQVFLHHEGTVGLEGGLAGEQQDLEVAGGLVAGQFVDGQARAGAGEFAGLQVGERGQ